MKENKTEGSSKHEASNKQTMAKQVGLCIYDKNMGEHKKAAKVKRLTS